MAKGFIIFMAIIFGTVIFGIGPAIGRVSGKVFDNITKDSNKNKRGGKR